MEVSWGRLPLHLEPSRETGAGVTEVEAGSVETVMEERAVGGISWGECGEKESEQDP